VGCGAGVGDKRNEIGGTLCKVGGRRFRYSVSFSVGTGRGLPSFLFTGSTVAIGTAAHDFGIAAHHVSDSRFIFMAVGFVLAGRARVSFVSAQAVRPAIVHASAVVRDSGGRRRVRSSVGGGVGGRRRVGGSVGAVVPGGACGQLADALFVAVGKVCHECFKGLVGRSFVVPHFTRVQKEAGIFEGG